VTAARADESDALREFDIPAGDAAEAFRRFSESSGKELLYASEIVRGIRTTPLRGEFTPREALERMLAGTDLVAAVEPRSGALIVKRKNGSSAPQTARDQDRRPNPTRTDSQDDRIALDEYLVTGSRLALNSGELPTQPLLSFTSDDIERLGASNLGQLFQYIPAITSYNTGLGSETVTGSSGSGSLFGQVGVRTSAQLRGGSQTETLLLVDGKRVPLTGLRNVGGNGYDLGGIPLSAIERVEVLLDGASAIYGADAVNGVINVILKKRYSGTELNFNYDNTFDKDAAVMTASLTHGFARGKFSGLVTLSASENNIMLLRDRRLTSTFDRRVFGGIVDQSQPTLYVEGTGSLNRSSGTLPGTSLVRVSIPSGYDGGAITPADYAAAPAPIGGITPERQSAINYAKERAGYVRLGYEFGDALTLTASARLGRKEYRDNGLYRRMDNVTLPAGYPGNPFGVPVRLSKIFYDLPLVYTGSETSNDEFSLNAAGNLPRGWRYDASVSYVEGNNNMLPTMLPGADGRVAAQVAPTALFTSRLNAEIAAGRRPLLVYDSNTRSPNPPDALDVFWVSSTQTKLNDRVRTWTYSAQVDGTVLDLPAGALKTVFGAEMREEYIAFPNSIGGQDWPSIPQRDIVSFYAEARAPIFGEKQGIRLLHQLDVNLAVRTERYSDFGRSTTPRYGIAWRPFKPLLLRLSYGEGFLAPQLYRTQERPVSITLPPTFVALLFAGQVDLSRGNTPITGPLDQLSGGNPALEPQKSENLTFGTVVDVPKIPGLSFSLDYYDNRFTDGFGTIASMMDRQRFAPETITRGEKLPDDPADWLGPIVAYDGRVINISSSRTAGLNFGMRYRRSTKWGDFGMHLSGEKTLLREERILPDSALTPTVDERFVPQRITLGLTLGRDAWEAGITGIYGGRSWTNSSNPALAPSRYTDDVVRWDVTAGYEFGRGTDLDSASAPWWRRALHATKLRVTIINLFDTEPPLNVNGSFSSAVIDPRLRRYVLDLTKRF
jgi:outer membrane receptor protein involved in Fe transport